MSLISFAFFVISFTRGTRRRDCKTAVGKKKPAGFTVSYGGKNGRNEGLFIFFFSFVGDMKEDNEPWLYPSRLAVECLLHRHTNILSRLDRSDYAAGREPTVGTCDAPAESDPDDAKERGEPWVYIAEARRDGDTRPGGLMGENPICIRGYIFSR